MADPDKSRLTILRLFAKILDVPVERFFSNDAPSDALTDLSECLRLWDQIATAEGRQQALKSLRNVVDNEKC